MSLGPTTASSTAPLAAVPPALALPTTPRLRGVLHLIAFPVSVVTGGVLLLAVADSPAFAASTTRTSS